MILPPTIDPLRLSAGAMASAIREGALSVTELIGRSLVRARVLQAELNCFVLILDDEASRAAAAADRAVSDGRPLACRSP